MIDRVSRPVAVVIAVASIVSVSSADAQTATTFNLRCEGSNKTISRGVVNEEPQVVVYRVDLRSKRYCVDACETVRMIHAVTAAVITFEDTSVDTPIERYVSDITVSRETGKIWSDILTGIPGRSTGDIRLSYTGTCQKQPFGGFPVVRRKF